MTTEITSNKGTFSGSLNDAAAWVEEYQPSALTIVVDGRELGADELTRCEDEDGCWDAALIRSVAKRQGRTSCSVCGDSAVCVDGRCAACA